MSFTCSRQGKIHIAAAFQLGNQKEGYHFGDIGINGRIILSWMCRKVNSFKFDVL
jgi:hypothetical protein